MSVVSRTVNEGWCNPPLVQANQRTEAEGGSVQQRAIIRSSQDCKDACIEPGTRPGSVRSVENVGWSVWGCTKRTQQSDGADKARREFLKGLDTRVSSKHCVHQPDSYISPSLFRYGCAASDRQRARHPAQKKGERLFKLFI